MGDNDVIKKDLLVKRAQLKGFFQIENYKRRWFELCKTHLRYSEGNEMGVGKLKGQVSLKAIKNVETADAEPLGWRSFAFQVAYMDNDERIVLYIIANCKEQQEEWIQSITHAALQVGADLSSCYHPGVWTKSGKFSCCYSINKRSKGCQESKTLDHNNFKHAVLNRCHDQLTESIKLLALYDYTPMQEGDLELNKGDEYELLDEIDEQSSWWRVKNQSGKVGYVPANYVQKVSGDCLDQYDWYYKAMSRHQSEEVLEMDGREGVFLVRDSSQKGFYTLSLFTKAIGESENRVRHYLIKKKANMYYVSENHPFTTIPQLIYYHMHNCAGLIVRLRFPAGDKQLFKPPCGLGHDLKEIDEEALEIQDTLGKGQFGQVNKGLYQKRIEVAVKTMATGALEEDFIAEALTMTKLHHCNLVKLYGVCTKNKPIKIITEYLKNGALLDYLITHKIRLQANIDRLVEMCSEVAKGMEYLEEEKVIHRDLAARNCLVDEKGVVKVGDFGLARYVLDNEYMSSTGSKFPVRWSAPEVLSYNRFSSKSDVWAFGVLMWEVFTCGQTPYGKIKNLTVVDKVCEGILTLYRPKNCPPSIYDMMTTCWNMTAEDRPSFKCLNCKLEEMLKLRDYDGE